MTKDVIHDHNPVMPRLHFSFFSFFFLSLSTFFSPPCFCWIIFFHNSLGVQTNPPQASCLLRDEVRFWAQASLLLTWANLGLSYPNFVWGLLLDDMQPLVGRFGVLGVLCCTICEVPRRVGNQKEAGLRDPWNSVMWRRSKGGVFAQSVSFRNFFES